MRKYKKILKDELDDVQCDICGRSCKNECSSVVAGAGLAEYATLEGTWGYCSRRDGERFSCEMCEDCFEKVSAFIDSLKASPASS
jgi:hypothetical protein